jgi:hypothetical protein
MSAKSLMSLGFLGSYLGGVTLVKPNVETMRDAVARVIAEYAAGDHKSVLVMWAKDREENFVPQEKGLQLHQDTVEFIDTDGAPTVLPFSMIARIEIHEGDTYPETRPPRIGVEDGAGEVVQFPKKRATGIEDL